MSFLLPGDFALRTPDMLTTLTTLVEMESPSENKPAVDALGAHLAGQLRQLGALVTVHQTATAGNHLEAHWGLGRPEERMVLLCHMDTVYDLGTLARQPVRVDDDKLFGPGTLDMKASIAIGLTVLDELKRRRQWPARPLTWLITSDEEVGSTTSRTLIEDTCRGAALVLCLEPGTSTGALKTARKGIGDFTLTVRGQAAHSGIDHARGRNAIVELAHHLLTIHGLTNYEVGTTLNVGVVRGGSRSNVVPDEASAQIDLRVPTLAEAERVLAVVRGLQPVTPGTTLEVSGGLNRPPMPRDALMQETFATTQRIAALLDLTLTEASTGGGSDANFVAPLGVPLLDGLGAVGDGAHSEREHILIPSLPDRAALLAALLSAW